MFDVVVTRTDVVDLSNSNLASSEAPCEKAFLRVRPALANNSRTRL